MTSCGRFWNRERCSMKPITAEWVSKAEGDFAVSFRYPGESADKESAMDSRRRCRRFRLAAREVLGLKQ